MSTWTLSRDEDTLTTRRVEVILLLALALPTTSLVRGPAIEQASELLARVHRAGRHLVH